MNNDLYLHQMVGTFSGETQYPYFGDGSDGVLNVTSNTTLPSSKDRVIVKYYRSITVNSGITLTVSNPCAGMILYSLGDVIINGKISVSQKGNINASKYRPYVITKNYYPKFKDVITFFMSNKGFNTSDSIGILPQGGLGGSGGSGGSGGVKYAGSGGSGGSVSKLDTYCSGTGGAGGGGGGGGGTNTSYNEGYTGAQGGPYISHIESYPSGGAGGYYDDHVNRAAEDGKNGGSGGGGGGCKYIYSAGKYGCYGPGGGGGAGTNGVSHGGGTNGTSGEYPGGLLIIIARGDVIINGVVEAEGGKGGDGYLCEYTTYSNGSINDYSGSGGGGGGAGGGIIGIFHAGTFNNNGKISVAGGIGGKSPAFQEKGAGNSGSSGSSGSIKIQKVLK